MLILAEDVNDNAPIFRPHSPVVRVREHSKPQIITTVEATDRDSGIFGQVTIIITTTTTTTTTTNKQKSKFQLRVEQLFASSANFFK